MCEAQDEGPDKKNKTKQFKILMKNVKSLSSQVQIYLCFYVCVTVHTELFFRVTVVSLAYQSASLPDHLMKSHTFRNFVSNCLTKKVSRHQYEALHNDMTHHSCMIRTIISWFLYCLWSTSQVIYMTCCHTILHIYPELPVPN